MTVMTASQRIIAKSLTPSDLSDSVVVSFSAHWLKKLEAKAFSAIIRKRVPTNIKPGWLYFHVNSPVSAICARAGVRSVEKIRIQDAVSISDALALSKKDIETYMGDSRETGAYFIQNIELSKSWATLARLNDSLIYYPPQSFFILSVEGKQIIDQLCQFHPSE